MNTARYFIALFLLVVAPGAFAFWLIVHPFIQFWRRIGARWARTSGFSLMILLGLVMYFFHGSILAVDYGTNWSLIAMAAVLESISLSIAYRRRKHLTKPILVGTPELSNDKTDSKLLNQGIYSRIRHPRYVESMLECIAFALFANYQGIYILVAALLPVLYLIVLMEEKELRDRFGDAYVEYSRRVPRFFPRIRGA